MTFKYFQPPTMSFYLLILDFKNDSANLKICYSAAFLGTWENKSRMHAFSQNYVMLHQIKSFEALQTVKSSIVPLCGIFKSIFEDSNVSYLIETKGLPFTYICTGTSNNPAVCCLCVCVTYTYSFLIKLLVQPLTNWKDIFELHSLLIIKLEIM